MNKTKAILEKCKECMHDYKDDILLCEYVECPLWPYRIGYTVATQKYKARMKTANTKYPDGYAFQKKELRRLDKEKWIV